MAVKHEANLCTQYPVDYWLAADSSQWQDQEAFKQALQVKGYKIKKFKVTSGNCYEIYGWNKDGKKVEIYFNPVTGEPVKSKIKD